MAESNKKVKRRIVPTQILDDGAAPTQSAVQKSEWSMRYQNHHKSLYEKDAIDKIKQRAVALGYEKERKKRTTVRKKVDDGDHGDHGATLHHFGDYIKTFLSLRPHSKGVSILAYLQKNFDKNMYFSSKTKRFRKNRS